MSSIDLSTQYMGLNLTSPLVVGASPMADDVDTCRRLEEAGAGALVMHSLFEEQITRDEAALHHHTTAFEHAHPEASGYFPEPEEFVLGPDSYLEQVRRLSETLSIPVIGSLNGVTIGGWTHYAKLMEQAGARGLELNVYHLPYDPHETPRDVEQRYLDVLTAVKMEVRIPVALKLSPFFSAPVYMGRLLDDAGADALVLFNRFYQPDIDIDTLDVHPVVRLSDSHALLLRLRWLAAMFGHVECSLAATGGVHTAQDAIKAIMTGANIVQLTSALLRHGPDHLRVLTSEIVAWLADNEYVSVDQMRGSMSLARTPDPDAYARANYMKVLQSWRLGVAV
jgi:dihydroorotate dehydrogenase (fumarate)